MMRHALLGFAMLCTTVVVGAQEPVSVKKTDTLDPLTCRWTFGNHEPLSMYRRAGRPTTGGAEGGALWLADWHSWFDSEACPSVMQELGLNFCHCRFYKGMGWNFESRDFPNVKRFVENAHRHGVRVLAYVQFSTLYYETMLDEVPDLADWAAVDENGKKRCYNGAYYRWMPCINAPGFEPYLKKMIRIALAEGGFDGVMLDNAFAPPCYCPRCRALFREHLARVPAPEQRFGLPTVAHVEPPPPRRSAYGEIQDPIEQQWIQFGCGRLTALYGRLYAFTKSVKPDAVFSANICNIRRANMAGEAALNMPDLGGCFDLYVSQSGNAPNAEGGCIVNRVRELKLARALRTPILALCDGDGGISDEARYFLPLMEDVIWGGIPTDRTVLKPDRANVSPEALAFRRPLLQRFNETVRTYRESLSAQESAPLRLFYSRESVMYSEKAHRALLGAEEILLRNHVPYELVVSAAERPPALSDDGRVVLVPDQRCLSDKEVEALVQYARSGGRLVVTGASGAYDPLYRQRRDNPLVSGLAGCPRTVVSEAVDEAPVKSAGGTIKVAAPSDNGKRLLADLAKHWTPDVGIDAPPTVLAEIKRDANAVYVHLLNYAQEPVGGPVHLTLSAKGGAWGAVQCAAPLEGRSWTPLAPVGPASDGRAFALPAFRDYLLVKISRRGEGP